MMEKKRSTQKFDFNRTNNQVCDMNLIIIFIIPIIIFLSYSIPQSADAFINQEKLACMDTSIVIIYDDVLSNEEMEQLKHDLGDWVEKCERYTPFNPFAFFIRTHQLSYNPLVLPELTNGDVK